MTKIGFIGLGIMGKGMLKNLITKLDAKNSYVIWNRSPEAAQEISQQYPGRVSSSYHHRYHHGCG